MMLIIQFLQNTLRLYIYKSKDVFNEITINNITYQIEIESKEAQGFIGFYDWLRSDFKEIIGIRLCLFEHHSFNKVLSALPYARNTFDGRCTEFSFVDKGCNQQLATDQDFGGNYFYTSVNNEYLLTANLEYLSSEEYQSLADQCTPIGNVSN